MESADNDVDRRDDHAQRVDVEDVEIAPTGAFRGRAAARERRDLMTTGGRLGVYPRADVPARPDDSDSHMYPAFLVDAGDEVKAASFL